MSGVCPSEVAPGKNMPKGDAAVVCMDGFDLITRQVKDSKYIYIYIQHVAAVVLNNTKVKSPVMANFVKQCELRGLPLNLGKEVIHATNSTIFGRDLDGSLGSLRHSKEKGVVQIYPNDRASFVGEPAGNSGIVVLPRDAAAWVDSPVYIALTINILSFHASAGQ